MSNSELECKVCGDASSNWHYGAVVCEACKKFFIRSVNEPRKAYFCEKSILFGRLCAITPDTRKDCQHCRYQKCLQVGLNINTKSSELGLDDLIKSSMCKVCSSKSTGIHFGVMACEACKGFFRRSSQSQSSAATKYRCLDRKTCEITPETRNCRYCRYQKCLRVGMAVESARLGRKPNIVKQQLVETSRGEKRAVDHVDQCSPDSQLNAGHFVSKRARFEADDEQQSSSGSSESSINVNSPETTPAHEIAHINQQLKTVFGMYKSGRSDAIVDRNAISGYSAQQQQPSYVSPAYFNHYYNPINLTDISPYVSDGYAQSMSSANGHITANCEHATNYASSCQHVYSTEFNVNGLIYFP